MYIVVNIEINALKHIMLCANILYVQVQVCPHVYNAHVVLACVCSITVMKCAFNVKLTLMLMYTKCFNLV